MLLNSHRARFSLYTYFGQGKRHPFDGVFNMNIVVLSMRTRDSHPNYPALTIRVNITIPLA